MAKRKLKKQVKSGLIISGLLVLIVAFFILVTTNFDFVGKKSIHNDARKYKTSHCLAFYPDSKEGKDMAKKICKDNSHDKQNRIFDYSLIPYGDYYLVSYGGDYQFYTDKEYQRLVIDEVSEKGLHIIADYVRYTVKKNEPEKYYNADFIAETVFENIKNLLSAEYTDIKIIILGPLAAAVPKVNGKYRFRMVIKCKNSARFREMIKKVTDIKRVRDVSVSVDINPENII